MQKIKNFIQLGRKALVHLLQNDPLRMAGATAFFTLFALPPMLILLVQVFQWVIGSHNIKRQLFINLSGMFGEEAVRQLVSVIRAIRSLATNSVITVAGFIFLLFVITTLFRIFRNSINQLWQIKPVAKKQITANLQSRLKALGVLMAAGLLLTIGFGAETIQAVLGGYIFKISPQAFGWFNLILTQLVSIVIVTCWFTLAFRYLPDGRPEWPVAGVGGLVTALLFTLGRLVMHALLTLGNIMTVYGASAYIVLVLLFIFYSALILYYGASFTRSWAIHIDKPIQPLGHAVHYKLTVTNSRDGNL